MAFAPGWKPGGNTSVPAARVNTMVSRYTNYLVMRGPMAFNQQTFGSYTQTPLDPG